MQTAPTGCWKRVLKGTEVLRRCLLPEMWPTAGESAGFDRKKVSDCPGSPLQGSRMPRRPPSTRRMTHRGAAEVTAGAKGARLGRKCRFRQKE